MIGLLLFGKRVNNWWLEHQRVTEQPFHGKAFRERSMMGLLLFGKRAMIGGLSTRESRSNHSTAKASRKESMIGLLLFDKRVNDWWLEHQRVTE